RGQLDAVAEEMQLIVLKSSHSSIVSESLDATSALFDLAGMTTAQAVAIPIHLGVLAELGRRFAAAYPAGGGGPPPPKKEKPPPNRRPTTPPKNQERRRPE
ncbi:MAG: hydantoinase B/oxoprolinase family protein, partial [Gammaproteobacteria bacterium]|nr:hydantoinase B/oxoprolinase family protein [Gammaproteobacteria bacterium]